MEGANGPTAFLSRRWGVAAVLGECWIGAAVPRVAAGGWESAFCHGSQHPPFQLSLLPPPPPDTKINLGLSGNP